MRNINEVLDDVEHGLKKTDKNVRKLNRGFFHGFITDFFVKEDDKNGKPKIKITKDKSTKDASDEWKYMDQQQQQQRNVSLVGKVNGGKVEPSVITGSDREKEMNDNLDEMSKGLNMLANMAQDMSFELDKQNKLIERIEPKVNKTQSQINSQNSVMKKNLGE